MKSTEQLKQSFKRPRGLQPLDLVTQQDRKPTEVLLRIAKSGASFVKERQWTDLVQMETEDCGDITATFNVCDMGDFFRFVLGFGKDCKVLAPESLRERVRMEAESLVTATRR